MNRRTEDSVAGGPPMTDEQIALLSAELIRDEGEVLHAYPDSRGYLTIGIGHLIDKRRGGAISKAASRFIFAEDLAEKVAGLDRAIPWWRGLPPDKQRVVVNLCFQLGIAGLLKFKKMLAALQARDYATAAKQLRASALNRQTPERTERRAKILESGAG